jgi:hypothetical protein
MRVMPVRWAILCSSTWAFTQGPRKLSGHIAFCEADICTGYGRPAPTRRSACGVRVAHGCGRLACSPDHQAGRLWLWRLGYSQEKSCNMPLASIASFILGIIWSGRRSTDTKCCLAMSGCGCATSSGRSATKTTSISFAASCRATMCICSCRRHRNWW